MRERRGRGARWPLETAKVADLASLPAWAQAEPVEPSAALGRKTVWVVATILAFAAVPFLLALGGAFFFLRSDPALFVRLVFVGTLGGVGGAFSVSRRFVRRIVRDHRSEAIERLEARGEATLGGEFVGIAYTEGYWQHPRRGDDFDEGVLRIDFDRLTFVGRDTRFELPASAVGQTEIRRSRLGHSRLGHRGERYRLYVHWSGPKEGGVFSVALPYQASDRRRAAEILGLQERIEAWRDERRSTLGRERPFLAPPSIESPKPGPPAVLTPLWKVGKRAKGIAAVATIPVLAAAFFLVGFFHGGDRAQNVLVPLAYALWIVLANLVEKRLPESHRYQTPSVSAPAADLDPAADLGPGRAEDEATVRQRA